MGFTKQNEKERLAFIDLWSKYVIEHNDKDWSRQQNVIINSCIRSANMSIKDFLRMKSEKHSFGS